MFVLRRQQVSARQWGQACRLSLKLRTGTKSDYIEAQNLMWTTPCQPTHKRRAHLVSDVPRPLNKQKLPGLQESLYVNLRPESTAAVR